MDISGAEHGRAIQDDDQGREAGDGEDIETTFRYLENLIDAQMAVPDAGSLPSTQTQSQDDGACLPLADVLDGVGEIFASDAKARGLNLRVRACAACVEGVPALPLMRILSNLVGNAIKYAESGGVLLAAKRIKYTGPGLSEAEFGQPRAGSARID